MGRFFVVKGGHDVYSKGELSEGEEKLEKRVEEMTMIRCGEKT